MGDCDQVAGSDEPIVSIILPTYNRAALLERGIRSVLRQTMQDFELIIIDDGSDDDTAEAVGRQTDPRIQFVSLGRNRGLSSARNAGLARARGRFLAFQDSDDEWQPEKLELELQAFEANPEAAVVYGDMIRQFQDGRQMYMRSPRIQRGRLINPHTHFWQTYMLAMQPSMIRRSCAATMRFDEDLMLFEDLDFHLRLASENEYVPLSKPLVTYHETGGLTADHTLEYKARRQLLRKHRTALLRETPGFVIRESANILLRRSLMPIVRQHLSPL